jgi:hypothetical protein
MRDQVKDVVEVAAGQTMILPGRGNIFTTRGYKQMLFQMNKILLIFHLYTECKL